VPKGLIKNKGNKMDKIDLAKLQKICESKIDNKEDVFDFLEDNFIDSLSDREMSELENYINDYILVKEGQLEKNQKYWMLITNPSKWGEGEEPFKVNQLLYDLDEVSWTINKNTDITHQMKKGHKGIIKVSQDNRSRNDKCDDEGNTVDELVSGIYGIFEVVEDEDGDSTYELEDGNWLVNIKMINNFYEKDKIVYKDDAIKYLGKDIFFSIPSRKISEKSYLEIIDFQKTL